MDGCYDNDNIVNIISEKYIELYNSVPYDAFEMNSMGSSVLSRILNSSCSDYIITVTDVYESRSSVNVHLLLTSRSSVNTIIAHLKSGKSDGSEGLFSEGLLLWQLWGHCVKLYFFEKF